MATLCSLSPYEDGGEKMASAFLVREVITYIGRKGGGGYKMYYGE